MNINMTSPLWTACALLLTLIAPTTRAESPVPPRQPHVLADKTEYWKECKQYWRDDIGSPIPPYVFAPWGRRSPTTESKEVRYHHPCMENMDWGQAKLSPAAGVFFSDRHRMYVREFYSSLGSTGQCPEGLLNQGDACLPSSQDRQWKIGERLREGVMVHQINSGLHRHLGALPEGHELVRVGNDILLLNAITFTVVDAIENLGGLSFWQTN